MEIRRCYTWAKNWYSLFHFPFLLQVEIRILEAIAPVLHSLPCSFWCQFQASSPTETGKHSDTFLVGILVLFNSLEQLESTQLTTTWAWKCPMTANKILHATRHSGNHNIQQEKVQRQAGTCELEQMPKESCHWRGLPCQKPCKSSEKSIRSHFSMCDWEMTESQALIMKKTPNREIVSFLTSFQQHLSIMSVKMRTETILWPEDF